MRLSGSHRERRAHRPPKGEEAARDTLRLVRLRLTLALIATAFLPIAVGAPIVRLATDDSRAVHVMRQGDLAYSTANVTASLVSDTRARLAVLAADPLVTAVALGAKAAEPDAVVDLLRVTRAGSRGLVTAIAVSDADGAVQARVGTATIPASTAGDERSFVQPGLDGTWQLVVREPILGTKNAPRGSIVAFMPLAALLDVAVIRVTSDRHAARIVETATGRTLAGGDRMLDAGSITDQVIGLATDATGGSARAPVIVGGLPGLAVEFSDPFPVTALPLPVLGTLVGLVVLLVAIIVWMARRILHPAAEIDASRTRLRLAYHEAREAALRDSLTGLGNHRAFQEEFAAILDQARRYGHPMSLVLIDIDEFKLVNDSEGHAVGDDLLEEIGSLMRQVARQADRAFRIGGDEFALLLTHTDGDGAVRLARRLLATGLEVRPDARYDRPISFSAGVAVYPEHGTSREDLQLQADIALYRGKRSGRTAVTMADPTDARVALDDHRRAALSATVARVISDGSLSPVYQPIVHVPTGRVIGFEGLIRPAPGSGFTGPGDLFAAAALTGRSVDLDLACLKAVVSGASVIQEPSLLAVNISPRTLEAPEFGASRLLALLDAARIDPARVVVELTEHETIEDMPRVKAILDHWRTEGIRIAADDVGAGNAGLRLLSQYRFDVVKIDLSLIHADTGRAPVRAVLGTIVGLAETWGALVVAEGVETPEQMRTVRALGIEAAQGYLLGRPAARIDPSRVDIDGLIEYQGGPLAKLGLEPIPVMHRVGPTS